MLSMMKVALALLKLLCIWIDLERPLVLLIAHMIRSKVSVPHDIIQEVGQTPIMGKIIFQYFEMETTHKSGSDEYPTSLGAPKEKVLSKHMAEHEDNHCRYAEMQ